MNPEFCDSFFPKLRKRKQTLVRRQQKLQVSHKGTTCHRPGWENMRSSWIIRRHLFPFKFIFQSVWNYFSNEFYGVKRSIWLHRGRNSKLRNSRIRAGNNVHVCSSNPLIFLLAILECDVNRLSQAHMLHTCSLNTQQLLTLRFLPAITLPIFPAKLLANGSLSTQSVYVCALNFLTVPSPPQATALPLRWNCPHTVHSWSTLTHLCKRGLWSTTAGLCIWPLSFASCVTLGSEVTSLCFICS